MEPQVPSVEERLRVCLTLTKGLYILNEHAAEHSRVQTESLPTEEVRAQLPELTRALRDQLIAIQAALPIGCTHRAAPSTDNASVLHRDSELVCFDDVARQILARLPNEVAPLNALAIGLNTYAGEARQAYADFLSGMVLLVRTSGEAVCQTATALDLWLQDQSGGAR